ncbi:MAG: exodeoxyribonuclease VII small subunit [Thermaerobacter sp.]|nr:exodeoxyribonuclease VII small subunit [Thermaerobacter sp.]
MTFEEAMTRLEQVVAALERGDLPLEESLRLFEEGVALSRRCHELLRSAEGKVEVLLAEGTQPLETGGDE